MPHSIRPTQEELSEARELIRKALEKAEKRLPREEEVVAAPAWTEKEFVLENMDGTVGMAHSATFLVVNFNATVDNWRKAIQATTVHEYGHTWYYEKRYNCKGRNDKIWQYVIDEALTQNLSEQLIDYEAPQREEHSKDEIAKYWPEIRDRELDRDSNDVNWPYSLYINKGDGEYPNWLGYSMSYYIGKQLLKKGHELEDFTELEKQDVIEAGDQLFGQ